MGAHKFELEEEQMAGFGKVDMVDLKEERRSVKEGEHKFVLEKHHRMERTQEHRLVAQNEGWRRSL